MKQYILEPKIIAWTRPTTWHLFLRLLQSEITSAIPLASSKYPFSNACFILKDEIKANAQDLTFFERLVCIHEFIKSLFHCRSEPRRLSSFIFCQSLIFQHLALRFQLDFPSFKKSRRTIGRRTFLPIDTRVMHHCLVLRRSTKHETSGVHLCNF